MPDTPWQPNAPSINHDFTSAHDHAEPAPENHSETGNAITQSEISQLQYSLAEKPPAPSLTIGGATEASVHATERQKTENDLAIKSFYTRRASERLNRDFERER